MAKTMNVFIPRMGNLKINFFGPAETVFDSYQLIDEFSRQKAIPHLGIINQHLHCAQHTRFDYLVFQLAMVDLFDTLNKGSLHYSVGSIKINGVEYQGNAVLKSWFMLSNLGHLSMTLSDEQFLADMYSRRKGFKTYIKNKIADTEIIASLHENLIKGNYRNFHFVISFLRINNFPAKSRSDCMLLLKLLFCEDFAMQCVSNTAKFQQLTSIYKLLRDLAIVTVDSDSTHVPISFDFLSYMNSVDTYEVNLIKRKHSRILHGILEQLNSQVYFSKETISASENYKHGLIQTYSGNYNYGNIIKELTERPTTFQNNELLRSFLRIEIQDDLLQFIDLFKLSLLLRSSVAGKGIVAVANHCEYSGRVTIDFLGELSQATSPRVMKIGMSFEGALEVLSNLKRQLTKYSEELWNKVVSHFGPLILDPQTRATALQTFAHDIYKPEFVKNEDHHNSINGFVLHDLIRLILGDNYYFDITDPNHNFVYFADNGTLSLHSQFLDSVSAREKDPDRKHEMGHFLHFVKQKSKGFKVGCSQRVLVYDRTQPPGKSIATDFDSIQFHISQGKIVVTIFESKNTKRNQVKLAQHDLKTLVKSTIKKEFLKGSRIIKDVGYGARLRLEIVDFI